MSERRKQGSSGPRGRSASGPRAVRRRARAAEGRAPAGARPSAAARPVAVPVVRPRSRLTGRAAVLVLVLAVLTVSYASSMRAYLQQRASINQLNQQIDRSTADIAALSAEKKQWNDPAYVRQQARLRLGYVMPGETSYLVLDEHGQPVDAQSSLADPATAATTQPTAWWSDEWASMELAGHPPKVATQSPATKINGAQESGQKSAGGG